MLAYRKFVISRFSPLPLAFMDGGGDAESGNLTIIMVDNGKMVYVSAISDTKRVRKMEVSNKMVGKTEIFNIIVMHIGNHRS